MKMLYFPYGRCWLLVISDLYTDVECHRIMFSLPPSMTTGCRNELCTQNYTEMTNHMKLLDHLCKSCIFTMTTTGRGYFLILV